ncbi:hypothetical protein PV328_001394 [Microctonus aethiopoides]|uniref:ZP domain-containing protein n=1 Tax=Microctonus aethiopoides TaxID=144406 RepID=A0AA39KXK5_9HYME|nr:hypothetical protein PV328_001394 [Microctonus aethiopoides]
MRCLDVLIIVAILTSTAVMGNNDQLLLESTRFKRDTSTQADIMARNILEWIQSIYRQGIRKTRQESNGYLPPYGGSQRPPEKPRPFQPAISTPAQSPSYPPVSPSLNEVTNYPNYQPSSPSVFSTSSPGYPSSSTTYLPPSATYGYPSSSIAPPGYPSSSSPGPTNDPNSYPYSSPSPFPSFPTPGRTDNGGNVPNRPGMTPIPTTQPGPPVDGKGNTGTPMGGGENTPTVLSDDDDDSKHPPHIHELQVECSKTMMTINIEFNRQYDGVIYSKGFYMMPECRYVAENSGQTKYSFTVSLDSCGTEFINDFEGEAGQAYLENVLVLQNELGIQEVWDTVRRVRCLWEGNINKALTVSLSVDMLNQEIVTFSGDTATAKLDVQVGKGPFAPAATGLVKIGEPMTLVVSVEGDPGFDLQVRDCVARDEPSVNVVQLTDERGCILKPKIFGAFQKTTETGNTGASIIAYAFFQAFKFPDVMDLFIECNVELCKTDCEACPEGNQQIEPGKKKRDVSYVSANSSFGTLADPVRIGRGFRVIMPDDLTLASSKSLENRENTAITNISLGRNICMSYGGFYISFTLIFASLGITTVSSIFFYIKNQKFIARKSYDLPKGS